MLYPVLFNNLLNDFIDAPVARYTDNTPAVNVLEDDKQYTMQVAVPGIEKEFCRVAVNQDGDLEMAIENKLEHKETDKAEEKREHYLRREFAYGNYQQTYSLPDNVDRDHITAKVENGILTIALPKLEAEEKAEVKRNIKIE